MDQSKILVADDSGTIRTVVRRILTTAGYDVVLACDGRQAVDQCSAEQPNLVILDIQMPEMDGYAACQEILKLTDGGACLPIVFLTRDTANHLDALGSELGAYLPKPVREDKLLATVDSLLHSHAMPQAV
ncbi:response regulator [Roseimaritima ulvae]|uniref:Alkaline phosphatase synthesis transcriptional regulatory protein PhoP n=1 Tax=Roseimaritima ulvae TaxID=980254 RepID=A0A5B9QSY7_9BACT|nr:response regulator [Roseimaritima ulvae]QEG41049.1 Alkaline phosphatase synthesis transcriptional regulatory protein PhoP [Roseimaritima ulvae]